MSASGGYVNVLGPWPAWLAGLRSDPGERFAGRNGGLGIRLVILRCETTCWATQQTAPHCGEGCNETLVLILHCGEGAELLMGPFCTAGLDDCDGSCDAIRLRRPISTANRWGTGARNAIAGLAGRLSLAGEFFDGGF